MTTIIICFMIAANVLTFAIYAADKQAAMRGRPRVSELNLLVVALIGGSAGAITAQQLLRHKTRKEPFRTLLLLIALVQIFAVLAWLYHARLL